MRLRVPQRPLTRAALVLPLFVLVVALVVWRGPEWEGVLAAFRLVSWLWLAAALGFNLGSVVVRGLAWRTVIAQALPNPQPRFQRIFSAFAVGLLANAVLPGRIGELARVAVLRRRLPRSTGTGGTLLGTVFAHRVFDLVPALLLTGYVLATAKIPHWAITSVIVVAGIGVVLFVFAVVGARVRQRSPLEELGAMRRLVATARRGLGVMKEPLPALGAIVLQCAGWFLQLLAVYVAMRAFDIHAPLPAAALVLLLMNVATVFPLWPGNIGLLQAAVAIPLVSYGVAYPHGFAFGLGLQVLEMSVGVGVGLLFLAREGLSFAMLRHMEQAEESELAEGEASQRPGRAPAGVGAS